MIELTPIQKLSHECKRKKNKKLALKLEIQACQILTNVDEVCIPSLSSILIAVPQLWIWA